MKYHIDVHSPTSKTFRSASIAGKFDYVPGEDTHFSFDAELPTDRSDWQVGLICGPSGSGKSLLAREAFQDGYNIMQSLKWHGKAIVDDFPKKMSVDEITVELSSVGLSSIPAWFLPYTVLSNGQKFRADLARMLAENKYVVVDEFSSVVDRDVAKAVSYSVSRHVRKKPDHKFVAVSCHSDIIEWLEPDWVYYTATHKLESRRLRRPQYKMSLYRGDVSAWQVFRRHHYMIGELHPHPWIVLAYVTIGERERICGFLSFLSHPGIKNAWRGHRQVILPDFQGIGLGRRFMNAACKRLYHERGCRIFSTTSSPVMNGMLRGDPAWRLMRAPSRTSPHQGTQHLGRGSSQRLTCSWEFMPNVAP
jgi:GNAT superfamily N-acetyltransferase